MEDVKKRAKEFEKEFKELAKKYGVIGFDLGYAECFDICFKDGSKYGKWFEIGGESKIESFEINVKD